MAREGGGDLAERIIGARRRLRGQAHRDIDGEGIQLSVDLDLMLMEAPVRPELADLQADDEIRALLDAGGAHTPSWVEEPNADTRGGHAPKACASAA